MHPILLYVQLGFEHISDLAGYDHLLFLVALCAVYRIDQWRRVLILVTAFTIGHSITLALVALDVLRLPSNLIEFLIPVTILLTALHNVFSQPTGQASTSMLPKYATALFFGLIHGMGFSNYFRALLMDESNILLPLLGFNVGIELGQIMIVAIIVSVAWVALKGLGIGHRDWNAFISGGAAALSLQLMAEKSIW